jgi:predicted nucleic acid-binding protein
LQPNFVIIDDKKARNEAVSLGLLPIFTTDVLRLAAERQLIPSYQAILTQLAQQRIYLPE